MGKGQGSSIRYSRSHQYDGIDTASYPSASSELKKWYDSGGWLSDMFTGGAMGQAIVADATNNYNRKLYDEYQSPAAMAKQYEEAGINRNFASEGAHGNIGQASSPNVKNSSASNLVTIAGLLNTFLGLASEGVNLIGNIQAVPLDIAKKKWENMILNLTAEGNKWKNDSLFAKSVFDMLYYVDYPSKGAYTSSGEFYNPLNSPAMRQAILRNDAMGLMNILRQYDLNNLKPAELNKINASLNLLSKQAGLIQKNIDWFEGGMAGKFLGPLLGILLKSIF